MLPKKLKHREMDVLLVAGWTGLNQRYDQPRSTI